MSEVVQVALISGGVALLIAIGGGLRYILSEIIAAYKQQASKTVDAKDAEIARLRDGVMGRLDAIDNELGELRQDVMSLRRELPR